MMDEKPTQEELDNRWEAESGRCAAIAKEDTLLGRETDVSALVDASPMPSASVAGYAAGVADALALRNRRLTSSMARAARSLFVAAIGADDELDGDSTCDSCGCPEAIDVVMRSLCEPCSARADHGLLHGRYAKGATAEAPRVGSRVEFGMQVVKVGEIVEATHRGTVRRVFDGRQAVAVQPDFGGPEIPIGVWGVRVIENEDTP